MANVTVSSDIDTLLGSADAAAARTNLGLGGAATLAVGTTAGTVAAGNDSRLPTANEKAGLAANSPTSTNPVLTRTATPVEIAASEIDWNSGEIQTKTLGANTVFTFANAATGKRITVALTNTASNYTVTWPTVSWQDGVTPVQTVGAKTDLYFFVQIGATIYGSCIQNF